MTQVSIDKQSESVQKMIDFDLQGIIGLRLVNPAARDVAALTDLLGEPVAHLTYEPDLSVRFTDDLRPGPLTYLGRNATAFTENDFYLLDKRSGEPAVQIPFDRIGDHCELLCRRNRGMVPLLPEIINVLLLKKQYVPLHASAFLYKGQGILVTGWTKGGKTESLLAFANHGAEYVGDEWVILSPGGVKMFGLMVPVTVWEWQRVQIPALLPPVNLPRQAFFQGVHLLAGIHRGLTHSGLNALSPVRLLEKALPHFKEQLKVVGAPQRLFGEKVCTEQVPVDTVILALSHNSTEITVNACAPQEVAARMHNSNRYERWYFFKHYQAFKFAFPNRCNEFLESIDRHERKLLDVALAGRNSYKVAHPYPVSLEQLYQHIEQVCVKG